MVQRGTIKVNTESGVRAIPIFDPGDVQLSIVRIETESNGAAAVELVDPSNTDLDEVRIETNNHGVKSFSHTKLKVDVTLNSQNAEITVKEDTTGDGNADNSDTVTVTNSGTYSYTLPNIVGGSSNDYWLEIQLTDASDVTKTAEINSAELKV